MYSRTCPHTIVLISKRPCLEFQILLPKLQISFPGVCAAMNRTSRAWSALESIKLTSGKRAREATYTCPRRTNKMAKIATQRNTVITVIVRSARIHSSPSPLFAACRLLANPPLQIARSHRPPLPPRRLSGHYCPPDSSAAMQTPHKPESGYALIQTNEVM